MKKFFLCLILIYLGASSSSIDSFNVIQSTNSQKAKTIDGPIIDSTYFDTSHLTTEELKNVQLEHLYIIGQVWGFLKYYHPNVSSGKFDWNAELFKILKISAKCKTAKSLSLALSRWIDSLGPIDNDRGRCKQSNGQKIALEPNYGQIFSNDIIYGTLASKLRSLSFTNNVAYNYYVELNPQVGNPTFKNENNYANMSYPDSGYRLLALFSYWNIINYFSPYRNLTEPNWNKVLLKFIPPILQAKNKSEYILTFLKLVACLKDTHANFYDNTTIEDFKGRYGMPFQAKFIENTLVVTGYYSKLYPQVLKLGDIIVKINGQPVKLLVKNFLKFTPASNFSTQLRDLPNNFLLRSNNHNIHFQILRNDKLFKVNIDGVNYRDINYNFDWNQSPNKPGCYKIKKNIAYLFAGKYKNIDLNKIKDTLLGVSNLIIDFRCYPSDPMVYTFCNYIKQGGAPFVKFSKTSINQPGRFYYSQPQFNGYNFNPWIKGRVIILVDERTLSQAEFTVMALQSSKNVIVMGSRTAGADGDISEINLPGGLQTNFSGLGVYYPDGHATQRLGVKIDYNVTPTIRGIKSGRDELLEKAINFLK